jgi:hypothetical protein
MPGGPGGAAQFKRMLEQPWPGRCEAALLRCADTRSASGARGVVGGDFRREPDQDPDRALDVSRDESRATR